MEKTGLRLRKGRGRRAESGLTWGARQPGRGSSPLGATACHAGGARPASAAGRPPTRSSAGSRQAPGGTGTLGSRDTDSRPSCEGSKKVCVETAKPPSIRAVCPPSLTCGGLGIGPLELLCPGFAPFWDFLLVLASDFISLTDLCILDVEMVTVSGLLRGQGENQPKVLTKHVVWVSGREINTHPTDLGNRELRLQDQREGRRIRLGGW